MAARLQTAGSARGSSSSSSPSNAPVPIAGNWQRLGEIGKGSFAMVYKGIHIKRRSLVAIKSVALHKLNKKLRENLYAEINILRTLQHPHIVALIDCQETEQHMHIVMEYCEMGDLSQFIKGRSSLATHEATRDMMKKYPNPAVGGLNEVLTRHFLKQIASALEFLRAKNYVHRDIKPQNLLLVPSPDWYAQHKPDLMPLPASKNSLIPAAGIESLPMLKIADFGFARVLPQTSLAETLCGSPLYMAPEILRYEKYDAKADLWSVGTVLHEMMVGKPPFRANNHVELLRRIEKQEDRIKFPEGSIISSGMKALIRALLRKSPTERIGFEKFFNDPVVREEIPGLVEEDRGSDLSTSAGASRLRQRPAAFDSDPTVQESESVKHDTPTSKRPPLADPLPKSQDPRQIDPLPGLAQDAAQRRPQPPQSSPMSRNNSADHTAQPRRPSITSHATAPPKIGQDKHSVAASRAVERRHSKHAQTPSYSNLKDHLDRERGAQRVDERTLREARERAAQDVAFERDYVVVEKRAVEVNALADELAHSPQIRAGGISPQVRAGLQGRQSSPSQQGAMVRRATTQGTPTATAGATSMAYRAVQVVTGGPRPDQTHIRTGSYDRRYGANPSSAASAISRALNMANFRLFGMGLSPPGGQGVSPPQAYGAFPTYPAGKTGMLTIGDRPAAADIKDEDGRIAALVEELAERSEVIYGFAEVKYKQLLPTTPSAIATGGVGSRRAQAADIAEEDDELTVDAVIVIAEEALVLYVKALATLAKIMDVAGTWWAAKNRGEVLSGSPRSATAIAGFQRVGGKVNNIVQWARNRFNECYDKSEFVGRKLVDAQKQLPLDHPNHPSNHSIASKSGTSVGTSAEDIQLTTGVTAEKLMYERACEMSRAAAVNELVNEDLEGCNINYRTAVWMLQAVLDDDDALNSKDKVRGMNAEAAADSAINGLEGEDRASIKAILDVTKARLKVLKKKLEARRDLQRRGSLPVGGPLQPGRSPPPVSSTPPRITHTPPR